MRGKFKTWAFSNFLDIRLQKAKPFWEGKIELPFFSCLFKWCCWNVFWSSTGFFYGSFFAFCLPFWILEQFWPFEVFLVEKKPIEYFLAPKKVQWVFYYNVSSPSSSPSCFEINFPSNKHAKLFLMPKNGQHVFFCKILNPYTHGASLNAKRSSMGSFHVSSTLQIKPTKILLAPKKVWWVFFSANLHHLHFELLSVPSFSQWVLFCKISNLHTHRVFFDAKELCEFFPCELDFVGKNLPSFSWHWKKLDEILFTNLHYLLAELLLALREAWQVFYNNIFKLHTRGASLSIERS